MILNQSDHCRYCGGIKMVLWGVLDYTSIPRHERHPPGIEPANNELQQAHPIHVSCSECGLVYDPDSLLTQF